MVNVNIYIYYSVYQKFTIICIKFC